MTVSFEIKKVDREFLNRCIERLKPIYKKLKITFDRLEIEMDLTACHANGCPIDFKKLSEADDFTFNHDISGIRNNLNRSNGHLENFFVPRSAL